MKNNILILVLTCLIISFSSIYATSITCSKIGNQQQIQGKVGMYEDFQSDTYYFSNASCVGEYGCYADVLSMNISEFDSSTFMFNTTYLHEIEHVDGDDNLRFERILFVAFYPELESENITLYFELMNLRDSTFNLSAIISMNHSQYATGSWFNSPDVEFISFQSINTSNYLRSTNVFVPKQYVENRFASCISVCVYVNNNSEFVDLGSVDFWNEFEDQYENDTSHNLFYDVMHTVVMNDSVYELFVDSYKISDSTDNIIPLSPINIAGNGLSFTIVGIVIASVVIVSIGIWYIVKYVNKKKKVTKIRKNKKNRK